MDKNKAQVIEWLTDFLEENEGRDTATISLDRLEEMKAELEKPVSSYNVDDEKNEMAKKLASHVVSGSETEEELAFLYTGFYSKEDIENDLKEKGLMQ